MCIFDNVFVFEWYFVIFKAGHFEKLFFKGFQQIFPACDSQLKGLCHPTRMREPMKTNLKESARLFQVVSEILVAY